MAIKVFPLTKRKDKDLHKTLNLVVWCRCLEESGTKKVPKSDFCEHKFCLSH